MTDLQRAEQAIKRLKAELEGLRTVLKKDYINALAIIREAQR